MVKQAQRDLAPERQERVRDFVRRRGVARVDDLCRSLGMSPATARRDLEVLESQGRLRRIHGGAMSTESRLEEPLFDDGLSLLRPEESHGAPFWLRPTGRGLSDDARRGAACPESCFSGLNLGRLAPPPCRHRARPWSPTSTRAESGRNLVVDLGGAPSWAEVVRWPFGGWCCGT